MSSPQLSPTISYACARVIQFSRNIEQNEWKMIQRCWINVRFVYMHFVQIFFVHFALDNFVWINLLIDDVIPLKWRRTSSSIRIDKQMFSWVVLGIPFLPYIFKYRNVLNVNWKQVIDIAHVSIRISGTLRNVKFVQCSYTFGDAHT